MNVASREHDVTIGVTGIGNETWHIHVFGDEDYLHAFWRRFQTEKHIEVVAYHLGGGLGQNFRVIVVRFLFSNIRSASLSLGTFAGITAKCDFLEKLEHTFYVPITMCRAPVEDGENWFSYAARRYVMALCEKTSTFDSPIVL